MLAALLLFALPLAGCWGPTGPATWPPRGLDGIPVPERQ